MDLGSSNTLLAGDPRLVDHIVGQVKSQGIFDQFRKECIADVDTKPAYQNLGTRVEGSVNSFLKSQAWKPDMNKNQLRETLRKHIHEASFLEVGVERIVDQVVNPKIYSVFMPQVEDVVYKFLGLERPNPRGKNGPCNIKDLLPKDLDPVSPESDRTSLKDESLESMDINEGENINGRKESLSESKPQTFEKGDDAKKEEVIKRIEESNKLEDFKKIEEFERVEETKKIFEGNKIEENKKLEEAKITEDSKNGQLDIDEDSMDVFEKPLTKTASTSNLDESFRSDDKTEEEEESPQFEPIDIMNLNESNLSNDSHLSGISELTSHRSRSPDCSNEFSRDHFDLTNHDQDSQLSKVSSNSRLSIVTDFGSSNQASTSFPYTNEDIKEAYSKNSFRAIRDIEEGKYKERKFNFEAIKNNESPGEKEKESKNSKSFSSRENSRDDADGILKEKSESRDVKGKSESRDVKEKSESRDVKEKSESRDVKEKSESRDGKERSESRDRREKNESSKSKRSKGDSRDSKRHKDRKNQTSSSNSRHSKSRKERDQSREKRKDTPDKMKEASSKSKEERKDKEEKEKEEKKDKDDKKEKDEKKEPEKQEILQDIFKDLKDIYKEKIRELREKKELTEKEKLNKDSKTNKESKERKDSSRDKKDYKKDHKASRSSDRHDRSSKTKSNDSKDSKDRKRDDRHQSKESRSRSSRNEKESRAKKEGKNERSESKDSKSESQSSKEKKQKDDKKSKSKDDHSSLRKNTNDRRSTDRDGSNGSNGKSSQKSTPSAAKSLSSTLTKETNNTNNSSGDTSDGIEDSQGNDDKLATTEFVSQKTEIDYKPSTNVESLHPERENSSKIESNVSELCLPLKKRRLHDDSSSSSPSGEPKVKKPKFAKNFHEAKKLMKIRKRMEKQNSEDGFPSKIKKTRTEGIESESLSNSPLPIEDITQIPDEERVKIVEVPDEECEVPYSREISNLTLEETTKIILQDVSVGQSDLIQNEYKKESKLSLMEQSIRKSLDEMMSDQKLTESSDVTANAERTIVTDSNEEESEIGEESSVKDSEESLIILGGDKKRIEKVRSAENDSATIKSEVEKVEEAHEKLKKENLELIDILEKDETSKSDESLNLEATKIECVDDKMKLDDSKIVSEEKENSEYEKDESMGKKKNTEDLIQNLKSEHSSSSEEYSQDINKKLEKNESQEKDSEKIENQEKDLEKDSEYEEGSLLVDEEVKNQEKEFSTSSPKEENCLYFEPDNERYLRFSNFLKSFEKSLNLNKEENKEEQKGKDKVKKREEKKESGETSKEKPEPKTMAPPRLKRKLSSSPLSDILLHNANNNNDGIKEGNLVTHEESEPPGKKRKLGRPKKQRPSLSSFNPPGLLNGENFIMPLSPESDVSATSEKTPGQAVKEEKSRQRNNQRYSSDDLYKPRPLFSSSSRRNRRSNQA